MAPENGGEQEVEDRRPDPDPGDAPAAGAAAAAPPAGKKPPPAKHPCLRCKLNVAKNSKSVKCSVCDQWVHKDCEHMSTEFFNILANPDKYGAVGVLWQCQACQAGTARIERALKNNEEKITKVEETVRGHEKNISDMDKRISKVEEVISLRDINLEELKKSLKAEILEEMRERECRKVSVVLHRVGECPDEKAPGQKRIEWDKQSCENIFRALELDLTKESVKFCRRVGERRETPRPLIVGFKCEAARNQLLESARRLADTVFEEVSVAPDLTRNQREEEENMKKEMEKRNGNLSQEDKQKNLTWAVVGAKGEKRLVKTTVKAQQASRGAAAATAPRATGGNGQALGTRLQAVAAVETRRERRGSKRGERSDEEEMEVTQPPAKR